MPRLISRNRTYALLNAAAFGTAYDAVRDAAEGLRRYSEDESELFYDQGGSWVQCSPERSLFRLDNSLTNYNMLMLRSTFSDTPERCTSTTLTPESCVPSLAVHPTRAPLLGSRQEILRHRAMPLRAQL